MTGVVPLAGGRAVRRRADRWLSLPRWSAFFVLFVSAAAGLLPAIGAASQLPQQEAPADEAAAEDEQPAPDGEGATGGEDTADEQPAAVRPIGGPQELLALRGVDPSHYRMLVDGRPIDGGEQEALLRFLYALGRFDLGDIERWGRKPFPASPSEPAAEDLRGGIFSLAGKVTRVAVEHPPLEAADQFELERYFRCTLELADGTTAEVYTLDVPAAWPRGRPLDERASAYGCFLKYSALKPERSGPVFVAQRVAWHPPTVLGGLGMDAGLFDDLVNRQPLQVAERECFFQLLAAAGRASPDDLARRTGRAAGRSDSVVPLFNDPDRQRGELVALTGTTRGVQEVLISVSDPDMAARLGFDRYFQIELFTADSQGNPLVLCVCELPKGFPEGPDVRERVRIEAFFFKTWSYRQQRLDESQPVRRQLAPMLIGRAPVWLRNERKSDPWLRTLGIVLLTTALAGVAVAAWRTARPDRRLRERRAQKRGTEPGRSLDDRDPKADDRPDFSGLS
jgi:hypothetical protein